MAIIKKRTMMMKEHQDFAGQVQGRAGRFGSCQPCTGFPLTAALNLIIAFILVIVLWPVIHPAVLLGWGCVLVLITAFRWLSALLFKRETWFFTGTLAAGLAWGAAAFLLFPGQDIERQFVVVLALAGISAAAMTGLPPGFGETTAFLCLTLAPLVLRLFLMGKGLFPVMGGMVLVYLIGLVLGTRQTHILDRESLLHRVKNIWEQTRLLESEERYHSLLDNLPIGIYRSTPGAEGRFLMVNSAVVHMFAYDSAEELYRTPISGLYADPAERKAFSDKLLSRGEVVAEELRLKKKNGEEIWGAVKASVSRDQKGEAEYFDGMIEDITQKKKAAEDVEKANRARSEFLASVSHELRTPLNGILGYIQILKKDKNVSPSQLKAFDVIERSGKHLLILINDILDYAKIEGKKIKIQESSFQFPPFLDGISEMIRPQVEQKRIAYHYVVSPGLPAAVHCDKERLGQVLLKLLSNAVKFTDRGSISFSVYPARGASRPAVRFQVEDTGIGIPASRLKEIFLPFKKLGGQSRKIEGTGLGLAFSRELVHLLGGKLRVKSTVGKGSTFWFTLELPDVSKETTAIKTAKPGITGYTGKRRKILVIDDNPINRMILEKLLAPTGFEVGEAADGREGVDKALKFKPDLIFMDGMMPGMDGFEAARQVRRSPQLGHIKMIMVSANVSNSDREQCLAAGCDDFLALPVQAQELYHRLATHLKLEWIYEGPDTDTDKDKDLEAAANLIIPPASETKTLYGFAEFGDFRGLHNQLNKIERMDNRYIPFVKRVRTLAEKFQIDEICEFIEEYIGGKPWESNM